MSTNEAALPQSTVRVAQADPDGILLVIHAGAGNRGKKDTPERRAQVEQDLNRALEAGYALLEQGAPAEDAVCAAIRVMEDAPEFNAGRGAALTSEGIVSMDSCLMTGVDGEVGSACGLTTSKNPINVRAPSRRRPSTSCSPSRAITCSRSGASNCATASTSSPRPVRNPCVRRSPMATNGRSMAPWRRRT